MAEWHATTVAFSAENSPPDCFPGAPKPFGLNETSKSRFKRSSYAILCVTLDRAAV